MNRPPDLDQRVSDWLGAEAPPRAPRAVLSVTLDRVAHVGQERPIGMPLVGWAGGSARLRWAILGVLLVGALLGAIAGTGAILQREDSVTRSPDPVDLAWNPERVGQDWPGPLRAEPGIGAPIAFVAIRSNEGVGYEDPLGDAVPAPLALVDIDMVNIREGCWSSMTREACIDFDLVTRPASSRLDPRNGWMAYGIVVDNTGDGHPDLRFGIDNANGAENAWGRMWVTDLHTGATQTFNSLEDPAVMDAVFPLAGTDVTERLGHVFVRHPGPVFRFYVWASAIVDGRIVGTDYAPDVGWIDFRAVAQPVP
jgi:hypothetical protein